MTGIIPAFTLGGITRPALHLDGSGNIVLDDAASTFAAEFGLKALYLGCPPGTPYPPVAGSLSAPVDSNATPNKVFENAAPGTPANITVSSTSSTGNPVTYSLTGDTSNGGFQINPTTGVVSVADGTKIDFETSPGHAYTITVRASDGILTSTQSFTINVGNVNEAPQGTSSHIATNEDHAHIFTVADFGFSDPHDSSSPNALQSVHINTVTPGSGSLTDNGNPVTAGSVISAADIAAGHLVFTPAANSSGNNYASFTFQVQDDGGTANGGVDTDPSPKTLTIDVNFVNDAPSFTVGANQGVLEDAGPQTVAGFATGISPGPANESSQTVDFVVSADTNAALFAVGPAIAADGTLTYTPAANANGSATITVHAHDNGGTANGGVDHSADQTFTINVTPVNDAPSFTLPSTTTTSNEDAGPQTVTGFATAISPGPANESSQTVGIVVSNDTNPGLFAVGPAIAADGTLTYTAAANANGSATITVHAHDNGGTANGGVDNSGDQTFSINVNAVNDAPSFTVGANQVALEDSGAHTVNGFVTGISPGPADEAGQTVNFVVSNDTNSGLFAVGPAIAADGTLTYTLAANANGAATITVHAHDNGGTANGGVDNSGDQTFTITANPVNDAPVGTSNTLTILEDHTHTFTAADFGFTDPVDAAGANGANNFQDVILTTLPGVAAGALTLSGGAVSAGQVISVANIGNLVFTPAANANGSPEASFTFQVQDDGGTANGGVDIDPTPKTLAFNVTPVNDAPDGTDTTIGAQGAHTFVTADFGFTDANDAAGASGANSLLAVEITTLPSSGTLTDNGASVTAGQFVSATDIASGHLVFTPSGIASGSFTFQVQDNGGTANGGVDLDPTPNTITVNQDAPPVVTAGHTLSYTENDAATPIDPALTVTDSDTANLAHATVHITGHYVIGEDVLGFTTQNGITGSFDAVSGTMTLSGSSSVANYQAALESVTYFNTSDNPSGLARTVTIIANDGTVDSAPATDTINVTPVNDPPVVTAGHTLNYTENQAATAFDSAITLSDVDSANLASATVHITGNYVNGQDVLAFSNTANITGTFDAASGTMTLTGSDTVAHYQAALAAVTYFNTSDNPSGLDRTVTIIANDGAANSTPVTDTIHVTPVDDAPVTSAGGTLSYLENQIATAIDPSVTVSDVDSANMASATVKITGNYVNGQDVLGFTTQNGITGSFDALTGTMNLTGSSSVANYKTALDSVTYFNSSDNPSGADRTVSYTVNDGTLNSNTSTSTIHVTPVNDAPVVTFGAITGFSEPPNGTPAANSTPVTIAPNLTITDAEGNNLTSATFVLTDLKPSDALSVSGHAGSSGDIGGIHFDISSTASTETVTLTGTDTIAHYNAVLDLVQFNNTSENPDTTARSYTVTAIDDGGTANGGNNTGSANTTETVTAVDDAPTASVPADSSIGTAFSHTNLAISGLSVADVDASSGNVTATISANNASLTFNTAGLASFTNNDSHIVTLTGTLAQVNTALSTLTYNSDDGFTGSDTVTLNVNDNGHTGTGGPLSSGNQTFHVGVVPQVFYIDNSSGGSNLGTQANPYTSIAAFNAANPAGSGDYVVLEHGTGTYSEANGINLANGVNLIGGSQMLQFTNPVTSQVVTANVGSGTDPVIQLTAGSADNGIDLLGTSGHTIAHVSVDTTLGTGMGISDDGNNVGTVAMSNIVVSTASGNGLNFTHGGTVTVTGTNHLISGTGVALDITNTTIGSANVTFQDITAGTGSGSAGDGIILDTTGSSGGLHVTGVGTTAGSGGTIQHKTGADGSTTQGTGIYLNNTNDVQLADMNLHDFQNYGIQGTNVTGFTLDHTVINGTNGTSSLLAFREGAVHFNNLLGSASITNSTLGGVGAGNSSFSDDLVVDNTSGTLNRLTVDNTHFGDIGINGNDALSFQASNSATANLTVTNSFFTNAIGELLHVNANNSSTVDAVIRNNAFSNNNPNAAGGAGDLAITGDSAGTATTVTYDVSHNTLRDAIGIALLVAKGNGEGTWSGTINANTVGIAGTSLSGSTQASGIKVTSNGTGTHTTLISNNVVHQTNEEGIFLQANDSQLAANGGGHGTFNATVIGNTVDTPGSFSFAGLNVDVGALGSDNNVVNVLIGSATDATKKNDFSTGDPANFSDVNFSTQGSTVINLSKNGSVSGTAAGVVTDDNLNGAATTTSVSGAVTLVTTSPALPPVVAPLLAAPGGVQASSPTPGETHLTMAELNSVVAAAIALWADAGASASQLAALHATTFSIADLSGNIVGQESSPAHITIDTNADGHGWFIDPTPSDNFEFTHAINSAGTDLLTDPSNAAAGHLDLLTTVVHEMGHVLGLPDSTAASDVNDLMYISLVDGERRLPDAAGVTQANATSQPNLTPAVSIGPATAPTVAASPANGTLDAGHGGGSLVGTPGADTFKFASVDVHAATPPPITHVAGYSFAQGDTFDFSALTSPLHASSVSDALVVRTLEDPSGSFATLQVNTGDCSLGLKVSNWVSVAQIDGAHAGDPVNVLIDSQSALHHAQIHVDLLV